MEEEDDDDDEEEDDERGGSGRRGRSFPGFKTDVKEMGCLSAGSEALNLGRSASTLLNPDTPFKMLFLSSSPIGLKTIGAGAGSAFPFDEEDEEDDEDEEDETGPVP